MIKPLEEKKLHPNEGIKDRSNFLRGTILEGLNDPLTGALAEEDTQLTKFHGIYQQDDRDVRAERRRKKMEKAYSFMIRVRVPGGVCSPAQYLAMDEIAGTYANQTLRLTTRQAFQFHGIIKSVLKPSMQEINRALLDTLAACGDVNRNVMCSPNPHLSGHHAAVQKLAEDISRHLTPASRAYHEIWLDEEKVHDSSADEEPIYGKTYLPRKFKTVVCLPPDNDVDIYAHCLGFIGIVEKGKLIGYNVTVGGGMGMTHGKENTFPRLADVMGFCPPEQAVDVVEKVVITQRDLGERTDRSQARLKYTVERMGVAAFRSEVEKRLGYTLADPKPFAFTSTGDRYGWTTGADGRHHFTLFVQNGRIKDGDGLSVRTGLREIARIHDGQFRLTPNQNIIVANISAGKKPQIEALLREYGMDHAQVRSRLRFNSMACVALPTCGLALAESERYLPDLVTRLEDVLEENGLLDEPILIRMTGCPNGCARPYLGEIGFVGRGPGIYNVYLGAGFDGARLNKLYRRDLPTREIVPLLRPVIEAYAKDRREGERFGDFVIRAGFIQATGKGAEFHQNLPDGVDAAG